MQTTPKLILSIVGLSMLAVGATYGLNPHAPVMGYVAAICTSVGSYLVGLYQIRPGQP